MGRNSLKRNGTTWAILYCGLIAFSMALWADEIHDAVRSGDLAKVRALLEKDPTLVKAGEAAGDSLLLLACAGRNSLEMVRLLVEHGAAVNASSKYGGTPLDLAYEYCDLSFVQYLESKGAKYSPIDFQVVPVRQNISRITCAWGMRNNIAVSAGADGILIVDSGFRKRATAGLKKILAGFNQGKLRYIVNSHLHGDHTAGNIMADAEIKVVDATTLGQAASASGIAKVDQPLKGRTRQTLRGPYLLQFNGEDILLIPYPGLHSDGDMLVYFSGAGVVHMGDLLLSQNCPAVQNVAGYLEFLEKAIDVFPDGTIFISGHGRDLTTDGLKKYRDDLKAMITIVKKNFEKGKSAEDMIREDILKSYQADYSFLEWLGPDTWIRQVCRSLKSGTLN